jgi:hypothetical protein
MKNSPPLEIEERDSPNQTIKIKMSEALVAKIQRIFDGVVCLYSSIIIILTIF